jgi:uncharacterized membrane protein YkgB
MIYYPPHVKTTFGSLIQDMSYLLAKTKQAQQGALQLTKTGFFSLPLVIKINRFSLFIVFFWFGILKVLSISPAETLVIRLHEVTLGHLISKESFLLLLGLVECFIGILWLFPKYTKLAFFLFTAQMFTTFLPMIFLPKETWQSTFVLTLTGQYIIKNLVLVASAISIYSHFKTNTI